MRKCGRIYLIHWTLILNGIYLAACTDDSINGDGGNPAIKGSILNDTRPDDGVKQGAINTDPMKPVVENGDKFVLNVTKPVSGADNPKEESKTTEQSKTIEHGDDEISDNGGSLLDTPQVLDDDAVEDDSYYKVHTLRLLMYIIAPVFALVIIYFVMKAVKGNSRHFFNSYQIVGARADNIELRPLGYESDEEDIVFDASTRN